MDSFLAALASAAALALLGEAVKVGLGRWLRPLRPDRCPRCGRENPTRALSRAETAALAALSVVFAVACTATVLLSVATVAMLITVLASGMGASVAIWTARLARGRRPHHPRPRPSGRRPPRPPTTPLPRLWLRLAALTRGEADSAAVSRGR